MSFARALENKNKTELKTLVCSRRRNERLGVKMLIILDINYYSSVNIARLHTKNIGLSFEDYGKLEAETMIVVRSKI